MALANVLGGLNPTQIAQETAKTLLPKLAGLQYFTLDLSNDIREKGEAVVTRVVTAYTSQDTSAGYTAVLQNTTTTAITVTLNQEKGVPIAFTDAQIAKAAVNLQTMVYEPLANAAAKDIYDYLFALILNANFSQKVTVAAASFDSDWLSDVQTVLNKAYVPDEPRVFIGNSDVMNALRKDTSFKAAYAYGTNGVIRDGVITRGMGFDLMEFTFLPSNSENLIGFGCGRQGIAFAARRLPDPTNWSGLVENITVAGVPFQFRMWYEPELKYTWLAMDCLYGASKAVTANICRVVSA